MSSISSASPFSAVSAQDIKVTPVKHSSPPEAAAAAASPSSPTIDLSALAAVTPAQLGLDDVPLDMCRDCENLMTELQHERSLVDELSTSLAKAKEAVDDAHIGYDILAHADRQREAFARKVHAQRRRNIWPATSAARSLNFADASSVSTSSGSN